MAAPVLIRQHCAQDQSSALFKICAGIEQQNIVVNVLIFGGRPSPDA
jgi:hypothetical protein